jgi:hypothetical protein
VYVLDGRILTAYSNADSGPAPVLEFPEGTTAFDIADLDGDGVTEVVAICGDRIMRYRFPASGAAAPPEDLFQLHTQLSAAPAAPYPCVLVVKRENRALLALPCETTFELRELNGTPVSSCPICTDATKQASIGSPFSARSIDPPQAGPWNALEMAVDRLLEFNPELPPDLAPAPNPHPSERRGTRLHMRDAADQGEESWPWFPLLTTGPASVRVLYAFAPHDFRDTLVRVAEAKSGEKGADPGPPRKYPGTLVMVEDELPDFNRDGYVDLLLWKAPEPGMSVDALTRAVSGGTWPLDLTVHLFAPEKNRYEPKPAARIACKVPVGWFLTMEPEGPMRNCVLRDLDGDGRTDFACSTAPNRFAVWLYGETGFAAQPDFDREFPEPITALEFAQDLDGRGRASVGLRTQTALYLLRPSGTGAASAP